MMFLVAALAVAVVVLAVVAVVLVRRGDATTAPTAEQLAMQAKVDALLEAQQNLAGQVKAVSDTQVATTKAISETVVQSQAELTKQVNERLTSVDKHMGTTLNESAKQTAQSLGELTARLETIDQAQRNIVGLADKVVSFQHVLDDNPARGAFGEMQLGDIVEEMLPPFAYTRQAKLENGKIVDYLIELPDPPGPHRG